MVAAAAAAADIRFLGYAFVTGCVFLGGGFCALAWGIKSHGNHVEIAAVKSAHIAESTIKEAVQFAVNGAKDELDVTRRLFQEQVSRVLVLLVCVVAGLLVACFRAVSDTSHSSTVPAEVPPLASDTSPAHHLYVKRFLRKVHHAFVDAAVLQKRKFELIRTRVVTRTAVEDDGDDFEHAAGGAHLQAEDIPTRTPDPVVDSTVAPSGAKVELDHPTGAASTSFVFPKAPHAKNPVITDTNAAPPPSCFSLPPERVSSVQSPSNTE